MSFSTELNMSQLHSLLAPIDDDIQTSFSGLKITSPGRLLVDKIQEVARVALEAVTFKYSSFKAILPERFTREMALVLRDKIQRLHDESGISFLTLSISHNPSCSSLELIAWLSRVM